MSYKKLDNVEGGLIQVYCKCGHSVSFRLPYKRLCSYCGRVVYPTKKMWFKDKLKIAMIKEKNKNE